MNTCPGGIAQGAAKALHHPEKCQEEGGAPSTLTPHWVPGAPSQCGAHIVGLDTSPLSLSAASASQGRNIQKISVWEFLVEFPTATGPWGFLALFPFFFSPHCNCTQEKGQASAMSCIYGHDQALPRVAEPSHALALKIRVACCPH